MTEARGLPAVQRAYLYVVALVSIHMLVLGLANLLRVGAELALVAPADEFTGLPFLFADRRFTGEDLRREHASLAIALLLVGGVAWAIHWRLAQRAVARAGEVERATLARSAYLHVVLFVTALLMFFHAQFGLSHLLARWLPLPEGMFLLGPEPPNARAVGQFAMVLAAGVAWWYHARVARADRARTAIAGPAAVVRRVQVYLLVLVGLFSFLPAAAELLGEIWHFALGTGQSDAGEMLRTRAFLAIPPIVTGPILWLAHWLPAQRLVRSATPQGEEERRSVVRKLAIYAIVFASAAVALVTTAFTLRDLVTRALAGTLAGASSSTLLDELGRPLPMVLLFAASWWLHRRVVEGEARREIEPERAANVRRIYYYLVSAISLAMLAVGVAGLVGVAGSYVLGVQTHGNEEIATYLTFIVVGLPAWAFHWRGAQRALDEQERRSQPRRAYLYLALFGGLLTVLVAGSAMLFQLINATLALSFGTSVWHDVWHLGVDSAVGASAFVFHWRTLRADRAVLGAAAEQEFPVTVLVHASDAHAARRRVEEALRGESGVAVR